MNEVVVGIDVGTTNVKVVAFDLEGRRPPSVHRGAVVCHQSGDRHEIDPDALLVTVTSTVAACLESVAEDRIVAIGLCTAMHGLCGLDAAGQPLTPILTWADGRAAAEAAALRTGPWHARTGTPVHPMSPLAKLAWFARHRADLADRVHTWVGIKALVMQALCGEVVTDASSASGTGLVALDTTVWDGDACAAAGVRTDQLPPIVAVTTSFDAVGPLARTLGLPPTTPVVIGAGDGPSANLGVGAGEPGVVAVSIGTSAAVRVVTVVPPPPDPSRFVYVLDAHRWVSGGAISNAGSAVDWVRDLVAPGASDAEIDALAASVPAGADGLVMRPFLLPERAPMWDPSIPGSISGLRARHRAAHFARAAFEGVAAQLALLAESVRPLGPIREVHATGGVLTSDFWRRLVASAIAEPVTVFEGVEAGALGAAGFALTGIALASNPDEAVACLVDLDALAVTVEADESWTASIRASANFGR